MALAMILIFEVHLIFAITLEIPLLMCYNKNATHFNIPMSGHTNGKNVCSHLTLGKMCRNIERCVFRAPSTGAFFIGVKISQDVKAI